MARDIDLPQGQIQPAARPIDAFVRPGEINVAQPNQLAQLSQPKGINTIGTGATPSVQGYNSYAQLAEALGPFSKELTQTLQTAGLMYAQAQIADGEKRSKNQVLQAMAQNDSAMESDELKRAAVNRSLAAKDPQAGGFMAFLNPYQQIGWERGKSKMAGQEAEIGLFSYVAQNSSKIDYTAPDQGFGALAQLQAQYTRGLAQKYGVDASSPGFQKYTLPALEKAQEKIQTQHLADRKTYFDTAAVGQASAQLNQLYANAKSTGQVEYKGNVYRLADNANYYWGALAARGAEIVGVTVMSGSLPGDASKRSESIFKSLRARADYKNDPTFRYFIDNIPGSELKRDVNGKTVVNPLTQQPDRLSWGEQFGQESLDSEIKYGQAGYTERKRQREEAVEAPGGLEDRLLRATAGMEVGPDRNQIADQEALAFYNEQKAKGVPVSWSEIKRRQKTLLDLNTDLRTQGLNPDVATDYFIGLEQRRGSAFKAADERLRVPEIAALLPEKDRAAFTTRALGLIKDREEEQQKFSGYNATRDSVLRININALLDRNYGPQTDRNKVNRTESERRMRLGLTALANQRLLEKEAQLKRRLTDSEVREAVQGAVDGYGKGDGGGSTAESGRRNQQRDYLFPGGKFSDEPSVRPSDVQAASQPLNPDGTPRQQVPGGKYGEGDLDYLPDRKVLLRNFRDKAILSPQSVDRLVDLVVQGKPIPAAVQRAWRDAGARNLGEFLLEQADFYPDIELAPQVRQKIQQVASTQAAAQNYPVAQAQSSQRTPLLASLGNWAMNTLLGAAPATAATMPTAMPSGGGSRPAGGGSAPGGGGGAPGGGTAAPVQVASRGPLPFAPLPGPAVQQQGVPYDPNEGGAGRPFGPSGSFEKPVSVVYENRSGQPGVDLYFPSKQFPAVLGGVVKDVSREPGYGNYVVVESVDPLTGRKVDVLYGHLADGVSLRPGQRIEAGQVVGRQGGTGNVRSADGTIASVDFFAPRPAGSKDMTPYSGFDPLRRHVVATLQRGGSGQPSTRSGGGLTGLATYYTGSGGSDGVAGGPTANGERYNPNAMTAAVQWSLRGKYLNKWVTVEDMDTGKTVRVWVNDVGQMGGSRLDINRSDPRVIDLSPAAFKQLFGSTQRGVGRIRILPI